MADQEKEPQGNNAQHELMYITMGDDQEATEQVQSGNTTDR